jgi:crotonobetainyl-CoA:carnitine CoA-transferase CaiB-like acyl-CoA transferase
MTDGALSGIKVIEYGSFIAGPYCARLLADFGAEVIKIEEPGAGDESRRRGPFPNDIPHPERSGLFCYLNWNKFGITLNPKISTGRKIFKQLISQADILIQDKLPIEISELGLDYESLAKENPNLIVTSITPFGQTGLYRDFKAYPLNLVHGGGGGYVLPSGDTFLSYPEREPIKTGGFIGEYNCGETAVFGTMAALFWRENGGSGQHVDISKREVLSSLSRYEFARYNQGFIETRATRSFPVGGLMFCKDGFIQVMLMEKKNWEGLLKLIGHAEWTKREEYQFEKIRKGLSYQEELNEKVKREVNDFITCWTIEHAKDEIYHQGQAEGIAVTKVATTQDVVESEQLKARQFFIKVNHPELGDYQYPSWPYKFSDAPLTVRMPAPLLGQHNEQVYTQLGYSKEDLMWLSAAGVI